MAIENTYMSLLTCFMLKCVNYHANLVTQVKLSNTYTCEQCMNRVWYVSTMDISYAWYMHDTIHECRLSTHVSLWHNQQNYVITHSGGMNFYSQRVYNAASFDKNGKLDNNSL